MDRYDKELMNDIDYRQMIEDKCDEIKEMLLEKNRKYGNSALRPKRVFSKADAEEQIRVRLDDKITRLQSAQLDDEEDPILDMVGYLILLLVMMELRVDEVKDDYEHKLEEKSSLSSISDTSKQKYVTINGAENMARASASRGGIAHDVVNLKICGEGCRSGHTFIYPCEMANPLRDLKYQGYLTPNDMTLSDSTKHDQEDVRNPHFKTCCDEWEYCPECQPQYFMCDCDDPFCRG